MGNEMTVDSDTYQGMLEKLALKPSEGWLTDAAKSMVTTLVIGGVYSLGSTVLTLNELSKMMGEQNIDKPLAEKLAREFQAQNGLDVPTKYMDHKEDPGPHYNSKTNTVGGPSEKATRTAIKKKELSGRSLSIDSPEIRLHELGHARSFRDKTWTSKMYKRGPILGSLGASYAAFQGRPGLAALLVILGHSPRLLEEWKASAAAKDFLEKNLPKEQAERAYQVLNRAFKTYLYSTGGSLAAQATYGWLRKKEYL